MKEEDWDASSEDEQSSDSFDSEELEIEDVEATAQRPTLCKSAVTDLRRRIEDRLESKRLRDSYEWDELDDDTGPDRFLDRLG
ncbi:hypothetical protein N9X99_01250 [Gammaproteobacteria bacterium]|nr:hypothetical protein [Gammaproteobacteria bacterium]